MTVLPTTNITFLTTQANFSSILQTSGWDRACVDDSDKFSNEVCQTIAYRLGAIKDTAQCQRKDTSDELPPGWTEHINDTSKDTYYWNAATGKSQWERPDEQRCIFSFCTNSTQNGDCGYTRIETNGDVHSCGWKPDELSDDPQRWKPDELVFHESLWRAQAYAQKVNLTFEADATHCDGEVYEKDVDVDTAIAAVDAHVSNKELNGKLGLEETEDGKIDWSFMDDDNLDSNNLDPEDANNAGDEGELDDEISKWLDSPLDANTTF